MRRIFAVMICGFFFVAAAASGLEFPRKSVTIPQVPGWPKTVPGSPTFSNMGGLVLADIDSDGELEVILGTTAGQLWAWRYDGTEIFSVDTSGPAQGVVAVGDVTGDSDPEIVVTTRVSIGGHPAPKVQVFSGAGLLRSSASMEHTGSLMAPPTLIDLDGDGKMEIIVGEQGPSSSGFVYALKGDLTLAPGEWPVTLDHLPAASAAAGDIDNDGATEIVFCSFDSIYAFEADGSIMDGFPVTFANENYSYGSPALADLDGDGKLEIVVTTHGDGSKVHAVKIDGSELTGWPYNIDEYWSFNAPSVADLDGDGNLEVIAGCSGGVGEEHSLFFINADGTTYGNSPFLTTGGVEGNFVVADFMGDDRAEVVYTNNIQDDVQGYLFAIDVDGVMLDGWPVRPEGFTYLSGPTIADMDGDGVPEFGVVGSQTDGSVSVNLYRYEGYYFGPGGVQWRTYQADDQHTGLYRPSYPGDDDSLDDVMDDTAGDDTIPGDDSVIEDDTADDSGDDTAPAESGDNESGSACGC